MKNSIEGPTPITRRLVPEDQRIAVTASLFGPYFPLEIEPVTFSICERMCDDYQGGYWNFYTLNAATGFFMTPDEDRTFEVKCQNYFTGTLSADALGIVCCLYAYSHLSFQGDFDFARLCAKHYHLLRHFMMDHEEVSQILGAID